MSTKWIQLANLPEDVKLVAVRLVAQSRNCKATFNIWINTDPRIRSLKGNPQHAAWQAEVTKRQAFIAELTTLGWEKNPFSRFDIFRQISSDNKLL